MNWLKWDVDQDPFSGEPPEPITDPEAFVEEDKVLEADEIIDLEEAVCTCTWGSYVKYAGGTAWDIYAYDPGCPVHGDDEGL